MARTPLLSFLQLLARDCRAARGRGVPLDVVRAGRIEPGRTEAGRLEPGRRLSRRTLLAGGAAGAAALALPRTAHARPPAARIAIVGGGIAGLAAARKLSDHGIAATVYEAQNRVGGRMFSNAGGTFLDGQVSEWCGELIDTGHQTIRRLAQRFGLPLVDLPASQPAGSEDTNWFDGGYYPVAQVEVDFDAVYDAVVDDAQAAPFPTTFDAYTAAGFALDHMSVHDWIESRVPGGHASRLGALLDVAYVTEYGADSTDQAALNLVYLLAYQPHPVGFAAFGVSDERFHIVGGNERLPQAIAQSLGSAVKLQRRLLALKRNPAGDHTLTFAGPGGTEVVVADVVLLTLPFAVLRDLDTSQAGFDALKTEAIRELGRGRNGKLQLQFASRPWNGAGAWPGRSNGSSFGDLGYQSTWDVTRGQPGASGILNVYTGGSVTGALRQNAAFATAQNPHVRMDAEDMLARLETVFPGLSPLWNQRATGSVPHASGWFKCSYSYYRVGQYTRFGGHEKARQGAVFFAGEHTSTDFQGYMEGGASEGERAAAEIRHFLQHG